MLRGVSPNSILRSKPKKENEFEFTAQQFFYDHADTGKTGDNLVCMSGEYETFIALSGTDFELYCCFSGNIGFSEWPSEGLNALETLDLSNNRLENISNFPQQCLASSPALTTLLLQNNDIHSIPYELGLLTSLRHLNMKGNPQKAVRANILEKSCGEILAYLRAKIVRK